MIEIKTTTIVSLTRSELERFDPCPPGLVLFDQIAPSGSISIEWTDLHAAWLVKATQFGPWLDKNGLIPSLRSVNWNGADLIGANLDRADLVGANLDRAKLVGASLDRAKLVGASLVGARLVGANLGRAYLGGANLDGAIWNQKFLVPNGWKLNEDRLIRA